MKIVSRFVCFRVFLFFLLPPSSSSTCDGFHANMQTCPLLLYYLASIADPTGATMGASSSPPAPRSPGIHAATCRGAQRGLWPHHIVSVWENGASSPSRRVEGEIRVLWSSRVRKNSTKCPPRFPTGTREGPTKWSQWFPASKECRLTNRKPHLVDIVADGKRTRY